MGRSEMAASAPALAGRGVRPLIDPGVVRVSAVRQDGAARISPVWPPTGTGDVRLPMMLRSTGAADPLHDGPTLIQGIVPDRAGAADAAHAADAADAAGEVKLLGRTIHVNGRGTATGCTAAVTGSLDRKLVLTRPIVLRIVVREIVPIRSGTGTATRT